MFIAMGVGYFGGIALGYLASRSLLAGSGWFAGVGLIVATPIALFLGTIAGGSFGGAFGELVLGEVGVPIGLALGIATTIGAVMFLGTIMGSIFRGLISEAT